MALATIGKRPKTGSTLDLGGIHRPTEELVIGMVGPIGAGVSTAAHVIGRLLAEQFGYDPVTVIKASDIIKDNIDKLDAPIAIPNSGEDRVKALQEAGSKLRAKFDNKYIIGKAIEDISISRLQIGGYEHEDTSSLPKSLRRVTIIDSLKHPEEARILRETYGGMYWQFSVFAPETVRERRLKKLGMDKRELAGIFTRDEDEEGNDHGQKVIDTAHLSDFFLRNDAENTEQLASAISRFLDIMFGVAIHTPNPFEAGMYAAVSAANKSACLSRQVGAAIYSEDNELISTGCNDVPRAGGGLYGDEHGNTDHRCFKWGGGICHNDDRKEKLYSEIFEKVKPLLSSTSDFNGLRNALRKTRLKQIIEYSRSIHAEMEAIVSAARAGKNKLRNAKLYTTTFPCHNCARHIVAAGISEVYYIEPYSKSLALDLHDDSISLEKDEKRIPFLQYEGVGPNVSMKLFSAHGDRKEHGKVKQVARKAAVPVLPPPLDGFTDHEKRVTDRIASMEETSG